MTDIYHYPPEVLNLLVDTIPLLCRSKNDILVFFRGAGVPDGELSDLSRRLQTNRESLNKYEITRTVIQRVNEKGDSRLKARREIVKRVVEFEDFSTCWPNDQLKAKGLVGELRRVVNVKDSFTRMAKEREREKQLYTEIRQQEIEAKKKKSGAIEQVKNDLYALFPMENEPQKRGKHLEKVLNSFFQAYDILIREDFRRVDPEGAGILEQIDGVIEFNGHIYLIEMKWVKEPIGVDKLAQHLVRIYGRHDARGLFIASNGYSDTAISSCREALAQKTIALISLHEIVRLLEQQNDLIEFLKRKVEAATVDKNPYFEILN
ncbi:restriction endonuclease [Methylomonas sp. OY6]|uniref:Restriction endonuclease n=1 Tax=Methylomonas defluvii TaxID=3045149 RepID=A0ABU4UG05_9GAMM|nr:restriction endonuclease [Methylomonas sp. OY6]MDX8128404.1 restriction endonuclease [Methylomonas sp. OY6]